MDCRTQVPAPHPGARTGAQSTVATAAPPDAPLGRVSKRAMSHNKVPGLSPLKCTLKHAWAGEFYVVVVLCFLGFFTMTKNKKGKPGGNRERKGAQAHTRLAPLGLGSPLPREPASPRQAALRACLVRRPWGGGRGVLLRVQAIFPTKRGSLRQTPASPLPHGPTPAHTGGAPRHRAPGGGSRGPRAPSSVRGREFHTDPQPLPESTFSS